ncbi:hypothetical protein Tco_0934472 [Tanacetum coccineum]
MARSNSVQTATRLFEFVISEKLALLKALKPYLMRGSSSSASTLNNSGSRITLVVLWETFEGARNIMNWLGDYAK